MTGFHHALFSLVLFVAAGPTDATGSDDHDAATRWVMGTALTIDIPGAGHSAAMATARDAAFAEATRWDNVLSNWRDDTPMALLNASAGQGPQEVSPDLFAYVKRAVRDAARTNGLFDITVGALTARDRRAPLAIIGAQRVTLAAPNLVTLPQGMSLDPGGDGKGFALDAMVLGLREAGISSAFVDFGGSSFYGLGLGRDGLGWRVALRGTEGVVGFTRLHDVSLSASASLRSMDDGSVVAHIVDPRDGRLVESPHCAFVISPSATDAEVLSTALIVSPPSRDELVARFPGAKAAVVDGSGVPSSSDGFPWEEVDEDSPRSP